MIMIMIMININIMIMIMIMIMIRIMIKIMVMIMIMANIMITLMIMIIITVILIMINVVRNSQVDPLYMAPCSRFLSTLTDRAQTHLELDVEGMATMHTQRVKESEQRKGIYGKGINGLSLYLPHFT